MPPMLLASITLGRILGVPVEVLLDPAGKRAAATAIAAGAPELLFRLGGDFTVIVTETDGTRVEHGPIKEFQR